MTIKERLDDLEKLIDKVHDQLFADEEKYEEIDMTALCIAQYDIEELRKLLKIK